MYGKLFSQMYDGTLATKGPWQALVTFQQLIILADKEGVVDMTPESISRRTTIPLEIITQGLKALEEPDSQSRSPALQGRRIDRLAPNRDWGWRIVNHAHYRVIRSQEDRKEYMRQYQAARRAEQKKAGYVNKSVNNVSNVNQSSKQEAVSIKPYAAKAAVASVEAPSWLCSETWALFRKHRGPKFTVRSQEMMIKQLDRYRSEGLDPKKLLERSIANGWKGVFSDGSVALKPQPVKEPDKPINGMVWSAEKLCWVKETK